MDTKHELISQPQVGSSEWLSALAKNIRAEGDDCARLSMKYGQVAHDCAFQILGRLADAIERTLESVDNDQAQPSPRERAAQAQKGNENGN
jgi:hypothetical protein